MKRFLLILLLCVPFVCNAQTEEKKYYIYSIVSFEGEFTKENFKVYFDDGKEVERMMDKVRCKICGKVGCMNQEYKEARRHNMRPLEALDEWDLCGEGEREMFKD